MPRRGRFENNGGGHVSNICTWLSMVVLLCLAAGCGKKDGKLPAVTFTPLAKQMPVPLGVSTVDQFVEWAATMPASQVEDVKAQIAAVISGPRAVNAVAAGLFLRCLCDY